MIVFRRLVSVSARRHLLLRQKSGRRGRNLIALQGAATGATIQRSLRVAGTQRLFGAENPLVAESRFFSINLQEEDEIKLSREKALRILEVSVADMSQADLDSAEEALFVLTEGNRDREDVELSWSLLDKLVDSMKSKSPTTKHFLERAVDWIKGTNDHIMSPKHQEEWLNRVIRAWSFHKSADPHPMDILAKIEHFIPVVRPDVETYTRIIKAVEKKESRRKAPALAETVLRDSMKKGERGTARLPDIKAVNTCICVWARSRLREAPQKAEALLLWANEVAGRTRMDELRPNTITYNTVLDAWAKSRNKIAPERCEAILNQMFELSNAGMERVRPDEVSFNTVMNAWAKSGRRDAPEKATAFLNVMLKLFDKGNMRVKPNNTSFNTVINAWAKARRKDSGKQAEIWLECLFELGERTNDEEQRPDTTAFNSTLDAWAKSGDPSAPEKAEALLNRMFGLYEAGMDQVKPNVRSFNSVVNTWAQSGRKDSGKRAEALLKRLNDFVESSGEMELRPNSILFNSTINAWAKSSDPAGPDRAEAILRHMEKLYQEGWKQAMPTVVSYNVTISAFADSSRPEAAEKALAFFDKMKASNDPLLKPTKVSYNMVLKTLEKQKDKYADRIDELRREMKSPNVLPR
jgi:hypothetical protein